MSTDSEVVRLRAELTEARRLLADLKPLVRISRCSDETAAAAINAIDAALSGQAAAEHPHTALLRRCLAWGQAAWMPVEEEQALIAQINAALKEEG